jgi:hypothetical protein
MGSKPRESWRAALENGRLQAGHAGVLDRGSAQGYTSSIYSPSDQPSGLRRGFVFRGQASPVPTGGWVDAA